MRKSYLFIFNDSVGITEAVKEVIDKMPYVYTWRRDMPNVFYIVSDYSAEDLAEQFEKLNGSKGRFIFMEYTSNSQGRLSERTWYLLNNKRLRD